MSLGATISLLGGCLLALGGIAWLVVHRVRASGPKDRR